MATQLKKNFINASILFFFFIIIFTQACDDTLNQIDDSFIPEENVSYSSHIQPVFEAKCNTSDCHNNADRAGGLAFTSWAETTANPLVVFPFEPNNSSLIWAIENQSGAQQMPPLGSVPLTENQRRGVRTWIAEGAQNN